MSHFKTFNLSLRWLFIVIAVLFTTNVSTLTNIIPDYLVIWIKVINFLALTALSIIAVYLFYIYHAIESKTEDILKGWEVETKNQNEQLGRYMDKVKDLHRQIDYYELREIRRANGVTDEMQEAREFVDNHIKNFNRIPSYQEVAKRLGITKSQAYNRLKNYRSKMNTTDV